MPQYQPQKKKRIIKAYLESLNTVEPNYHFFCTYAKEQLGWEWKERTKYQARKERKRTGSQLSRVFAAVKGRELSAVLF